MRFFFFFLLLQPWFNLSLLFCADVEFAFLFSHPICKQQRKKKVHAYAVCDNSVTDISREKKEDIYITLCAQNIIFTRREFSIVCLCLCFYFENHFSTRFEERVREERESEGGRQTDRTERERERETEKGDETERQTKRGGEESEREDIYR